MYTYEFRAFVQPENADSFFKLVVVTGSFEDNDAARNEARRVLQEKYSPEEYKIDPVDVISIKRVK